uniref:Uncharacterized protein n=1 Tax=Aegilops tauschii subsp. strangulata TaxID=200361 RepID=A0A453N4F5_AEGTS
MATIEYVNRVVDCTRSGPPAFTDKWLPGRVQNVRRGTDNQSHISGSDVLTNVFC